MTFAILALLVFFEDLSPVELAARHQAALDRFSCYTFRFVVQKSPSSHNYPIKGQVWRSGDRLRIYEETGMGEDNDRVFRDGEVWIWALVRGQGDRPGRESMGVAPYNPTMPSCMSHLEWRLLERHYVDDILLPLKEVIGVRTRNEKVRREDFRGRPCHVVEFDVNSAKYAPYHWQVYFDAHANYRTARTRYQRVSKAINESVDLFVEEWAEPKPGMFFPIKTRSVTQFNSVTITASLTVSDLQVFDELDPSIFAPRLKPGLEVFDRIRGQSYRHGEAKITSMPTGPMRAMPASIEVAVPLTKPQDSSWWVWLGAGLAALLCVAMVWRWRRALS